MSKYKIMYSPAAYADLDNNIVFYLVDNDRKLVTVARIFYSGQDIENIIKNSELNNY